MKGVNADAILAIWKRQLGSLLLNPLGYVFILAFVLVAAGFLFVPDAYFARNVADLGPLLTLMPWLLVVLLPALGMGSWAAERELGTEEQLLTLPMSVADALLGKWLGVASFYTLALLCSFSNVAVLCWLGDPDLGLVAANYVGWWCAGLGFAALSILASTLVSLPSIAFVLGALFCAVDLSVAQRLEWFDPFNRGLVPFGGVMAALVMVVIYLGLAALVVSSRRWRKSRRRAVLAQCVIAVSLAVTLGNLSVQADRAALDWDVTAEHLSSLSPTSLEVLKHVEQPVRLAAFISQQLPPEMVLKGKEVENTLKALDRELGEKLHLTLYHPADPLDEAGSLATQQFGLKPKKVVVETVTGREEREVFLGVAVRSGARSQRIDHFAPGLSVEYELVRTIRAVGTPKKKVLGLVKTDLKLTGGFDFQLRQQRQDWEIVREWRKQYEVREVNLDVPVGKDVDVLVAPQPSSLSDEQLKNLHDYIWDGRPALILEDPLPIWSGPDLGSSQPKRRPRPMMGMPPPPGGAKKGDLHPLLRALGLEMDLDKVAWSDFNPSHAFRKILPPSFVWAYRSKQAILDAPASTGIGSLLVPFPGLLRVAPGKNSELEVKPLVQLSPEVSWGGHAFEDYFTFGLFGRRLKDPSQLTWSPESGSPPFLAVEISGRMKRAYPSAGSDADGDKDKDKTKKVEGSGKDASKKSGGKKDGENSKTEAKEKSSKKDGGPEKAKDKDADPDKKDEKKGLGELSKNPIHVIFVADTDLAHDQFFAFYRNEGKQFSEDQWRFLQELGNVQFMANAVDALAGDEDFLELRTRRAQPRPLEALEEVLVRTQKSLRDVEASTQAEAQADIQKLRDHFQGRLDKIKKRKDLDENSKAHLVAEVQHSAQRQLDADIEKINLEADQKIRAARIEQQRGIKKARGGVRWLALGVPSLVLALLALAVFAHRLKGERLLVPESRKRGGNA